MKLVSMPWIPLHLPSLKSGKQCKLVVLIVRVLVNRWMHVCQLTQLINMLLTTTRPLDLTRRNFWGSSTSFISPHSISTTLSLSTTIIYHPQTIPPHARIFQYHPRIHVSSTLFLARFCETGRKVVVGSTSGSGLFWRDVFYWWIIIDWYISRGENFNLWRGHIIDQSITTGRYLTKLMKVHCLRLLMLLVCHLMVRTWEIWDGFQLSMRYLATHSVLSQPLATAQSSFPNLIIFQAILMMIWYRPKIP